MRLLPISLVPRPLRAQSPAPSFRDPKRLSSALEPFSTAAPPWPELGAPHRPRWPAVRQDPPQEAFRPLDTSLPRSSAPELLVAHGSAVRCRLLDPQVGAQIRDISRIQRWIANHECTLS